MPEVSRLSQIGLRRRPVQLRAMRESRSLNPDPKAPEYPNVGDVGFLY